MITKFLRVGFLISLTSLLGTLIFYYGEFWFVGFYSLLLALIAGRFIYLIYNRKKSTWPLRIFTLFTLLTFLLQSSEEITSNPWTSDSDYAFFIQNIALALTFILGVLYVFLVRFDKTKSLISKNKAKTIILLCMIATTAITAWGYYNNIVLDEYVWTSYTSVFIGFQWLLLLVISLAVVAIAIAQHDRRKLLLGFDMFLIAILIYVPASPVLVSANYAPANGRWISMSGADALRNECYMWQVQGGIFGHNGVDKSPECIIMHMPSYGSSYFDVKGYYEGDSGAHYYLAYILIQLAIVFGLSRIYADKSYSETLLNRIRANGQKHKFIK